MISNLGEGIMSYWGVHNAILQNCIHVNLRIPTAHDFHVIGVP